MYSQYHSSYNEKSEYRFNVFADTVMEIRNHNMGKWSWQQGINDYSDMTFQEFKDTRLMLPQNCSATSELKISEEFKKLSIP